ncbi:MAG: hypothetical protein ACK42Y_07385 [Candidatus Thermochlorobacter sp.]
MAQSEHSPVETPISFWVWVRAFLLSPGALFALLYLVAHLLQRSRFAWLIDWATK